ncbi:Glyoxylate reductase [uncultured archaeon]|nr:Glyoxylate reductase [uncultured archaeon]
MVLAEGNQGRDDGSQSSGQPPQFMPAQTQEQQNLRIIFESAMRDPNAQVFMRSALKRPDLASEVLKQAMSRPVGQEIVPDEELGNYIVRRNATGQKLGTVFSTYELPPSDIIRDPAVKEKYRWLEEHCDVVMYTHATPLNERQLAKVIRDHEGQIDVVLNFLEKVDGETVAAGARKGVRGFVSCGTGDDMKDKAAAAEAGIWCTNAPGALMEPVSEMAAAHTLNMVINLAEGFDDVFYGRQTGCSMEFGRHKLLAGSKVGFLGLGQVGAYAAAKLAPFIPDKTGGGELLVTDLADASAKIDVLHGIMKGSTAMKRIVLKDDTIPDPQRPRQVDQETLFRECDYVIIAVDLNEKTRGIVGESSLAAAKEGQVDINVGRGPLVDRDAMLKALREGRVHYSTDVDNDEWVRPSDYYEAAKQGGVVFLQTPHTASNTPEIRLEAMTGVALDNLIAILSGQKPPNPRNEPVNLAA